jgi:hypothetical protein
MSAGVVVVLLLIVIAATAAFFFWEDIEQWWHTTTPAPAAGRKTTTLAPAAGRNTTTLAPTWSVGPWGDCSSTCGAGTQSRTVVCRGSSGAVVGAEYCQNPGPEAVQSCNNACEWKADQYGPCTNSCGSGTRTRNVYCVQKETQGVVSNSHCSPELKPLSGSICEDYSGCVITIPPAEVVDGKEYTYTRVSESDCTHFASTFIVKPKPSNSAYISTNLYKLRFAVKEKKFFMVNYIEADDHVKVSIMCNPDDEETVSDSGICKFVSLN